MRLQGKVAVITGAGSGMGLAIATLFAAEGASVVAGDWNAERLDSAVAGIQASGGTVVGAQGNIADQATAEGLVDQAISTYGRLDVLCNNAGVMDYMQGVGELSDDIWRRVLSINLDGPMFTSRRALSHMLAQGSGSIINVASTAGIHGGAAGAAYTTSKHGLVGLTRNTAWMYAKRGIRCNAICPGATITNIGESMPQDRLDAAGMARAGAFAALAPAYLDPRDIATLALFLASDESRNINGAIIPADGGWAAV
ncbi:MAG TPA: SDR family oxidoreductase [Herpetosiphonaceae bacterium]|nr:SDR family oxidoreductase [Herpetosiphonaceae bacterium]